MTPLKQDVVGDIGNTLWVLMGAIGIVLVMACANVANLLLGRGTARLRELALRAAIGADRSRLIRQMPEPFCKVPIIALTADAMQEDTEKCIAVGMTDYISKPFRLDEIEEVLKKRMLLV